MGAKPACDLDNHLAQLRLALLGNNGRFLHQTALFIRMLCLLEGFILENLCATKTPGFLPFQGWGIPSILCSCRLILPLFAGLSAPRPAGPPRLSRFRPCRPARALPRIAA